MNEQSRQKLSELLRDFHLLTGIKICIYDGNRSELCFYPEKLSPFCRLLREDRAMAARCADCDRHAFAQCARTRSRYVYTCHAGLTECFSPILYNGEIIGYIVIGQIKTAAQPGFESIADRLPADLRERLGEEYDRLPALPPEKIGAAAHILDACAGYQHLKSLVSSETPIDMRIADHIEQNLTDDLSAPALCRAFRISRSQLYLLFRERFDVSVARFVRGRRLQKARVLLETTDRSIADVAVRCGLPDYNYFSKLFKAAFGVSPSQYRKSASIKP